MPPGPAMRFLPQGSWTTPPPGIEPRRPSHGQLQSRPPVLLERPLLVRPVTCHPFLLVARIMIINTKPTDILYIPISNDGSQMTAFEINIIVFSS